MPPMDVDVSWEDPTRPSPNAYENRTEAGRVLAKALEKFRDAQPLILALPRGGVPVAYEIALRLKAPLDVLVVRKVGSMQNPEYGLGAIVEGGERIMDQDRVAALGISPAEIEHEIQRELEEARRRVAVYRQGAPLPPIRGRTVILVDDGVATGGTVRVALHYLRRLRPKKLILAIGVAPSESLETLERQADEVVCPLTPTNFFAVGEWYRDFRQITDEEVVNLLRSARAILAPAAPVHA